MNFCANCGFKVTFGAVDNEHLPRFSCDNCQVIHYENPKIIVGCLPIFEDRVMLCKRGIEPQFGLWNIPGGFMENGETVEEGALREMEEETCTSGRILGLHTVFNVVSVNQVHIHYLIELSDLNYQTTPESTEITMFLESEIPWADIAFSSSRFALRQYFEDRKMGERRIHTGRYPKV
jgi:ADP-ribose pyrophosphatase YjhB (NUDIX family)